MWGGHALLCAVLLTSCFSNRAAASLTLCSWVAFRRRALTSRLWEPGSTRPAPRTPAAETAGLPNLHDLALAEWSSLWQRTSWSIPDCLRLFLHLSPAQDWWGSLSQKHQPPPSPSDLHSSLDRLLILDSERLSSRQTPTRSSRRGWCYRTWCWGTRGLQAPGRPWFSLQLYFSRLHRLTPPPLSDNSPDRGAQGKWPHWESPCPLKDPCPSNQNDLRTWTWSLLWGSAEDMHWTPRGKATVSLSALLFSQILNDDDVQLNL